MASDNDIIHDKPAAQVSVRIGGTVSFDAAISSGGLLSVGALVSGILLSSAVIVMAAGRRRAPRVPMLPPPRGETDAA